MLRWSDCYKCPLLKNDKESNGIVVGETNCDKLSDIKLLILAEAPASNEIKEDKPLIGKAGGVFRNAFNKSGLNRVNHFISNIVMCSNIENNKTNNPPVEAVECCKNNWQNILRLSSAEYILIMGGMAKDLFGIEGSMTNSRGKYYEYKLDDKIYKVFLTIHPSYINYNGGIDSDMGKIFLEDFNNFSKNFEDSYKLNDNEAYDIYSFKIPEKYMDEDYVLIDIQFNSQVDEIIYIFRNKDNVKEYYYTGTESYYFVSHDSNESLIPYTELSLRKGVFKSEFYNENYYEGNIRPEVKRSIDYYFNKKKERDYRLKVLFADIEVYNEGSKVFPYPKYALKEINSISFRKSDEDNVNVWVYKHKDMDVKEPVVPENFIIKFFDSEKELLRGFCKYLRESDVDILSFYNGDFFDIPYIVKRMEKNDISIDELSPLNFSSINNRGVLSICGIHIVDQLVILKKYSDSVEPTYKLSYISEKYLGTGKVAYEGTLDDLYNNDISKFILYSGTDTNLLKELDDKLGHISLLFEMIKICSTTWQRSRTTMGLLDPLMCSYAKHKGLVCKNSKEHRKKVDDDEEEEDEIEGAMVKSPRSGIHNWVVDFDFASLYPSIIRTFNIGTNTFIGKIDADIAEKILYNESYSENVEVIMNPVTNKIKTVTSMSYNNFKKFLNDNDAIITITGCIFKGHDKEESFFSQILKDLMDKRKIYKNLRKDNEMTNNENLLKLYDNRQWAYKILTNAIYGVLLNKFFRFYNTDLGESITLSGQELLKYTSYHLGKYMKNNDNTIDKRFLEKFETEEIAYNIYGDTDSMFIGIGEYMTEKGII